MVAINGGIPRKKHRCNYCKDTGWNRLFTVPCTACPKGGAAYISPPAPSPVPPSDPRGTIEISDGTGEGLRDLPLRAVPQEAPAASEPPPDLLRMAKDLFERPNRVTLHALEYAIARQDSKLATAESENARLTRELKSWMDEHESEREANRRLLASNVALDRELAGYREVVEAAIAWDDVDEADDVAGLDALVALQDAIRAYRASLPPTPTGDPK